MSKRCLLVTLLLLVVGVLASVPAFAQLTNYSIHCNASASASTTQGSLVGSPDSMRDDDEGSFLELQGSFTWVGFFDGVSTIDLNETVATITRVEIVHALIGTSPPAASAWNVSLETNGSWQSVMSGTGNFNQRTDGANVNFSNVTAIKVEASGGGGNLTVADYYIYELRVIGPGSNAPCPICGNGLIEPGESCDDGNADVGDGCDATCEPELGYFCTGEPSFCYPVPDLMTGFWRFDEISGPTVTDEAGTPNNGTLMGSPGPTRISGRCGNGLSFDGIDDFVAVPHHQEVDVGTEDFSLSAWVKNMPNYGVIADKRLDTRPTIGYALYIEPHLGIQLADSGPGEYTNFTSAALIPNDGAWHHVAASVDRLATNGGHLYLDGVEVFNFDPTVRSGSLANSSDLWIGKRHIEPVWLQGAIDEFRLHRRAISPTEVAALAQAPCPAVHVPSMSPAGLAAALALILLGASYALRHERSRRSWS